MYRIDLNVDLGEGEPNDAALMPLVSSCNIACGGHAGDSASMRDTLELAARHEIIPGAHPSYPDRDNFGRRSGFMRGRALSDALSSQLAVLSEQADALGLGLSHVKPHGALYGDANRDADLASILAELAEELDLRLVGPPRGELRAAASRSGVPFIAEGFIDRAYLESGELMPRSEAGAVYDDVERAAEQAVSIVVFGQVVTSRLTILDLPVQTLCLHGDTPRAIEFALAVLRAFAVNDIHVEPAAVPGA